MPESYVVTKRAANGAPREIHCQAHPACAWGMKSEGARRDDDPVFTAQFNRHLLEAGTTELRSLGRLRRGRT
ncbi:MAG: hypothetical protein ABR562_04945 [Thermoplasmatota archaeon]|nr:hypothetical protein [Halobacteriales archaeon]